MPNVGEKRWQEEAKRLLLDEFGGRRGSFQRLEEALNKIGVPEDAKNLSAKINRGSFTLSFFLQCIYALHLDKKEFSFRFSDELLEELKRTAQDRSK